MGYPPKIYRATELASVYSPVKPLVGNRRSAQAYVDRITRSSWWRDHAPGFHDFFAPPPERVWVWEGGPNDGGLMDSELFASLNGEEYPSILIGYGAVNGCTPAMADKWVILHELAHVMTNALTNDGHHGKEFCHCYVKMVQQYLGSVAGDNLIKWARRLKIRLDYGLLLSGL